VPASTSYRATCSPVRGRPKRRSIAEDLTIGSVRGAHARGETAAAVSQGATLPSDAPLSAAATPALAPTRPRRSSDPPRSGRAVGLLNGRRAGLPVPVGALGIGSRRRRGRGRRPGTRWTRRRRSSRSRRPSVKSRPRSSRFEPLVVTGPGKVYRGLLRFGDLLELFARLHVETGLEAHPLTGLPGRGRLEAEAGRRLVRRQPVALARFNLQGFRAFNDRYGFPRGDRLLAHVAAVLSAVSHEEPGSFLAHYSGDDFGFLLSPDHAREAAARAVQGVAGTIREFYDPSDLEAGGVVGRGPRGALEVVPPAALVAGSRGRRRGGDDDAPRPRADGRDGATRGAGRRGRPAGGPCSGRPRRAPPGRGPGTGRAAEDPDEPPKAVSLRPGQDLYAGPEPLRTGRPLRRRRRSRGASGGGCRGRG
jgi:GGDEF domain-containing protein